MSDTIHVSGPVNAAGLEMSFETGRLAQLADGAGARGIVRLHARIDGAEGGGGR